MTERGLGSIKEGNEDVWMFRMMFLQRIDLSCISFDREADMAKELRKALRRWRGMVTNATHQTDRKKWLKRVMEILERDVERKIPKEEVVG